MHSRHYRMQLGETAHMRFVEDGAIPRDGAAPRFALLVEIRVDDAFRHEGSAVALVESRVVAGFHLVTEHTAGSHLRSPKWLLA